MAIGERDSQSGDALVRKEFSTKTKALLWECFDYDPPTGRLTWKARPKHHFANDSAWKGINKRESGKPVDHITAQGYFAFRLNRKVWLAHRAIWVMHNDHIPEGMMLDHINRCKTDNRLENLRLATSAQNGMNKGQRKGKLLPKGVHFDKSRGKYMAYVSAGRKMHNCGRFETAEEAFAASIDLRRKIHGEFASTGDDL
jgi:hypothetical protein